MKHIKIFLLFLLFNSLCFGQKFSETKVNELQQNLDSLLFPVLFDGIKVSCMVMHADYSQVIYEFKPEEMMIPASITKLVTAGCAYYKLGANYNIPTIVYTDDKDIKDGIINGNLYLKGYGDPDLNSGDISYLARNLVEKGIKEITGNIIADETYFDTDYYTLSGNYGGDTGPSYWPYISALSLDKNTGRYDPATSAASLLSVELSAGGVTVQGTVISGSTPKGAKEISQVSHSIYDVISYMCKESDNHSALTMFKLLGAKYKDIPGSIEGGKYVIGQFLSEIGVNRNAYEILEGSGLTRYNRVSAEMYMRLLKYFYDDRFIFDYFMNSLTVAGKDGTLKKRMIGTNAEGNVFAKTGTLNGVSALSGYVIDADSEVLIFYIVMNGFKGNASAMRDVQDLVCMTLADFNRK